MNILSSLKLVANTLFQPDPEMQRQVLSAFKDGIEKRSPEVAKNLDIPLAMFYVHAGYLCKKGLLKRFEANRNFNGETVTRITHKITPQGLDFLTKKSQEKIAPNQNGVNMVIAN